VLTGCAGFFLLTRTALAQNTSTLALSLHDALARAVRASEEVSLARHGVESARGRQIAARSDFFPQVTLSASYERTLASEFDEAFVAPMDEAEDGAPPIDFDALPFGRENVYRASGTITQNVFAGGRTLAATRAASELVRQADIAGGSATAETRLATVEAYYDALLSDQFVTISVQTFEQAAITLEQVRLSSREGQESEFELLRAQVTLDNQRPNLVARRMQRELAYLRLKQQVGVASDQELVLTSALEDAGPGVGAAAPALDPEERAPVRQAQHAVRASEHDIAAARAPYFPSLSLSMTYGRVHYPSTALPDLEDWRTNWTAGAYLSWAVFDGFRTRGQVRSAEAEAGRARVRLAQARELARYESEQVSQQIAAAHAVYEASAASVEQARRAHAIAELRYREGVSTQLELSDSRLSLAQAETNRAQALRDLHVARARRDLLRDLPLLGTSSVPATQGAARPPSSAAGSIPGTTVPMGAATTNPFAPQSTQGAASQGF
jgi:outer membrane protein TolC